MFKTPTSKTLQLADGRQITLETGKLAKQSDGAVVLTMGKTMLLATVVAEKEVSENPGFLPLFVDYQEKFAAAGKIPGGFLRREGRLSDYEVLISRLVDRALRPLFPDQFYAGVQVNVSLISADDQVAPDSLAALAASAALTISPIPFNGPISEVRVARIAGQLCINPSHKAIKEADIDLIVAASEDHIIMVEGEMSEVSEEEMLQAIGFAHEAIKEQCRLQLELAKELGVTKRVYPADPEDNFLKEEMFRALYDKAYAIAKQGTADKQQRKEAFENLKKEHLASLPEGYEPNMALINKYFAQVEEKAVRDLILDESVRLDGRKLDEIRPIWSEVDYLPAAHGSALFTRGETQSLTTVTLGGKMDEQLIDSAMESAYNKFMLHYNFPSFCTGEIKPSRGPGRREIGHGNLALRALKRVLPGEEEMPYTIRIVSDILESNGSSSMATVCAGSLALMDAGVPVKKAVSGIAMGLITSEEPGRYAVISDILGDEDHLGDMDFKVAGTRDGITACQMDIKVSGLTKDILQEALAQAKQGRLHILDRMNETLAAPREDYKPHTPRIVSMTIPQDTIGAVIGPGGKVIQEMQRETGTSITIEEVGNKGLVKIFGTNKQSIEAAEQRIKAIAVGPEIGEVYTGKVKAILDFGAFVEFLPGRDGLLHISEVKWERIEDLKKVLEIGEEVQVKLIDIDPKTGKYRLSRKVLLPKEEANV